MKLKRLRIVILLGVLAIAGIVITQIYWVRRAFDLKEKQFNHNVHIALLTVAEEILKVNRNESPLIHPVKEFSPNYYVVAVNDVIDAGLLEVFLKREFTRRNILIDFEYGIYDCVTEKMVYGKYINVTNQPEKKAGATKLPVWEKDNYYFGVYFPNRDANLVNQMDIWAFLTFVLVLVIFFFGYAVLAILKQRRLSEIQKDFINNMTHEFKTPISTITISAEVLKDPYIAGSPERLINYATIIQNEANRLNKQVERVLQVADIEKEEMKLKKEPLDIHKIIAKSAGQLRVSSGDKVLISMSFNAYRPVIQADLLHFTNILFNLLDNAVKYGHERPEIDIRTLNSKTGVLVSISDNGIGIAAEQQKKVFDKFYRVPTGNLHDRKGFGLGLFYVRTIVKAHGGMVNLKSEFGKGTTIELHFPFK